MIKGFHIGFNFIRQEKKMKKFAAVVFLCLKIGGVNAQEQKDDLWILAVGINKYLDKWNG